MNNLKLSKLGIALIFLLLLTQVSFSQNTDSKAIRVLFVGNSFTYYFNLPQVTSAMAETQGIKIIAYQSTVGGTNLEQHWKEEKGTITRKLLDSLKWDFVVMNNHSLSTIETPNEFMEYGKKFAELIKSKGAKPVFMQTWGYKSNPLMIRTIVPSYNKLVSESNAHLVPCGELFAEARKWRPDLELFQDDKHPSSNGTYLLGLAFFKYFTGLKTSNIPAILETKDNNGEATFLIFMSQENADFLQQLVDDFEFKFNANSWKK